MSVSGKSLQDIYDAGSTKLEELTSSEKSSLQEAAERHLDERVHTEPESLRQLEGHSKELVQDVKGYLNKGMQAVEKALKAETEATEAHTEKTCAKRWCFWLAASVKQ